MDYVYIEHVKNLKKELKQVNDLDIDNVVLIDINGHAIRIPQEIKDEFKFTGLSIVDFITSEYYKKG
jgi:nitrous oxide reductase